MKAIKGFFIGAGIVLLCVWVALTIATGGIFGFIPGLLVGGAVGLSEDSSIILGAATALVNLAVFVFYENNNG